VHFSVDLRTGLNAVTVFVIAEFGSAQFITQQVFYQSRQT